MKRSFLVLAGVSVLVVLSLFFGPAGLSAQENQVQKAKIFAEEYPLISDSDMYCSILIWDQKIPEIKIIGSEREDERAMMVDSDTFYINKGKEDGLDVGQMFLALQIENPIAKLGYLAQKKGKVRIIRLEDHVGVVKIEKSCGDIQVGNYLIPFEEKETVIGKDLGYNNNLKPGESLTGQVIYLDTDFNIAATGHWALINVGAEQGLKVGQQMTIFRQKKPNYPREAIGNLVVIDTQKKTATVRVLSCREAVEKGDIVQVK
ncbi:MAG: hypothetical protein ACPLZD_00465 [Candidatus Saccharicenans sp.]|nr:MAG: hypothetical protein C0168_04670 [Candidatus Aminicenantes bacterium]HEK85575.1 hypothetical protein [Candidatus Aminicenantes bacterium]